MSTENQCKQCGKSQLNSSNKIAFTTCLYTECDVRLCAIGKISKLINEFDHSKEYDDQIRKNIIKILFENWKSDELMEIIKTIKDIL